MILHCELSKAASSVEWRRGGELLKHGDKYQVRKKELQVEMKILDLSVSDGGEYSCVCGEQATRAVITVKGELLCTFVYTLAQSVMAVYPSRLLGFSRVAHQIPPRTEKHSGAGRQRGQTSL